MILVSMLMYPLVYLFLEDSDSPDCSGASGHIHRHYAGVIGSLVIIIVTFSLICQLCTEIILRRKLRRVGVLSVRR